MVHPEPKRQDMSKKTDSISWHNQNNIFYGTAALLKKNEQWQKGQHIKTYKLLLKQDIQMSAMWRGFDSKAGGQI